MSNLYAKSTTGADANAGGSWALAKGTIQGMFGAMAPGDSGYVSQAHVEPTATAQLSLQVPGTMQAPVRVIAGNDSATPPVVPASGIPITTTGDGAHLRLAGSGYFRGFAFKAGTGSNYASIQLNRYTTAHAHQEYDACSFELGGNHPYSVVSFGASDGGVANTTIVNNCTFKIGVAGASNLISTEGRGSIICGGGVAAGSASPSESVFASGWASTLQVVGFDMSALGASVNLVKPVLSSDMVIRDSKLPPGWTGNLCTGPILDTGSRVSMYNSGHATKMYGFWIEAFAGAIKDEATVKKSGSPLSAKLASNAKASEVTPLVSDPVLVLQAVTAGVPVTATVEIVHDSATALSNAEAWLDANYKGDANSGLVSIASSRRAGLIAASANHPASTATWTTTGLSAPNKQKLTLTFTPNKSGPIEVRVSLAKPTYTVFADLEAVVA